MALKITKQGSVVEVEEKIYGWHDTKTTYWYCDIETWMVSSHGRKGDTPDRKMSESEIAWFKKYTLPKVQGEK